MNFSGTGNRIGGGIKPMACVCSTKNSHKSARNGGSPWVPNCVHCGCSCGNKGEYRTGNRVSSLRTLGHKQVS